jgi:serine/threonine protein kinase
MNCFRRLGPYTLVEQLGRGGMAAVYRAKRRGPSGFEKQVVVKTILPELVRNGWFLRRFKHEARLSAGLLHANVVQLIDFGIIDGTPFVELEYLNGIDLKQLWERAHRPFPVSIALALATEICRGLAYAHNWVDEQGVPRPIIHRDVSPANVMVCRDGAVKLLDFGLACLTRGETLAIDRFEGKLAYMAPEMLERRQLDRRADVFAFGAVLWELLTGRRLFLGNDDAETLRRLQSLPIPAPSSVNPAVPAALDVIVLRALQRDPALRQASAAEVLRALERLADRTSSRGQLLDWLGQSLPDVFDGGDTQVDPVITDVTQLDMIVEETQLVTALPPPRFSLPWRRWLALALTWFGLLWIALADRLRHVTSRVRAIRHGATRPSALPPPVPGKSASAHGTIS